MLASIIQENSWQEMETLVCVCVLTRWMWQLEVLGRGQCQKRWDKSLARDIHTHSSLKMNTGQQQRLKLTSWLSIGGWIDSALHPECWVVQGKYELEERASNQRLCTQRYKSSICWAEGASKKAIHCLPFALVAWAMACTLKIALPIIHQNGRNTITCPLKYLIRVYNSGHKYMFCCISLPSSIHICTLLFGNTRLWIILVLASSDTSFLRTFSIQSTLGL